jgi:type III pantothenate kinase
MAITLCLDFGNTRMKCAVFEDKEMKKIIVLSNEPLEEIRLITSQWNPAFSILSSVIDHDPAIEELLSKTTRFHRLGHLSRLPVTTPVGKPETIGTDRLALVVAAAEIFPESNCLVIGLGSAVTYNFVNKYRAFLGGGISPGLEMRLKSLQIFTAKLPLVKPDWNFPLVGYDTRTNILSGVILGMAKEIDGMIEAYEEKYSNFNVLLSGGDGLYFTRLLKKKIFADPDLIFKGLNAISTYNH